MLILTRYNGQRIVVIAPDDQELWITADEHGLAVDIGAISDNMAWQESSEYELAGETIIVCHMMTTGRNKPQHRIGIEAPKDYVILREELIKSGETT